MSESRETAPEFEGVEKLLDVVVRGGGLRRIGASDVEALVARSGASIVSRLTTPELDSYVLSESSLFVWDDRLLMLTCGGARLVASALALVDRVGRDRVEALRFARHGEQRPSVHATSFAEDADALRRRLGDDSLAIAIDDDGSTFHATRRGAHARTSLLRVLCFAIDRACALPFDGALDATSPRGALAPLAPLLDGATLHDHVFSPTGYSLNAIRGGHATALHVSPEASVRFASLVTTESCPDLRARAVEGMQHTFAPGRLDVAIDAASSLPSSELEARC